MFKAFYRYRSQAFTYEIQLLSRQLKQILGLVFLLLASALPGLVLLVFMSLGKVITAQGGLIVQAWVAWSFLAGQTICFYALRDAILNQKQRVFQASLIQKPGWRWLCDCRNLLACHVFFWCSLFLVLTMNVEQLIQNKAFILFMVLQFSLAGIAVYRMQQSIVFCLLAALSSVFWAENSMQTIMTSWLCLAGLSLFFPAVGLHVRCSVTNLPRLWLSFYLNHYQVLLWRIACIAVVFSSMTVLAIERPDMRYLAGYFCGFLSLLLLLTLHIEVKKKTSPLRMFLHSIGQLSQFNSYRLVNSWVLCTVLALAIFSFFEHAELAVSLWCFSVVCVCFAEKKPEQCALVWGICLVGGLFI